MRKLAAIGGSIEYLFRPVQETSILHRNKNGEYRTEKGHYYHSGNLIEVLLQNGSHEVPCWVQTKVEYDGEDYYLAGYEEVAKNRRLFHTKAEKNIWRLCFCAWIK